MGTIGNLAVLLASIATMMLDPLGNKKGLKTANRSYHYMTGGGNGAFYPKRTKFKGYMREAARSSFNKNK